MGNNYWESFSGWCANPQPTSRLLVIRDNCEASTRNNMFFFFLPEKKAQHISSGTWHPPQVLQAPPNPLVPNPPKITHPRLDRRSMRSSGLDESCLKRCVGSPSFDIFFVPWITAIQLLVGWWYLPYFFLKHPFVVGKWSNLTLGFNQPQSTKNPFYWFPFKASRGCFFWKHAGSILPCDFEQIRDSEFSSSV